ncbi:hypothetical protein [Geopseudomonas aromaticivorans]
MWPNDVEPGEYLVIEEGVLLALAGGDWLLLPCFEVVSPADAEARFTLVDGIVHPANPTWLGMTHVITALHRSRGTDKGQELLVAALYAGGEMLRNTGQTGVNVTMYESARHGTYDIHLTISQKGSSAPNRTLH